MKNYGTYDNNTLKKLQKVELDMLKDINKVCEKYKIKYFATDGTGLGAIRHKGFIPWDDDIDLRFIEEDAYKFVECMEKEMSDKYYFIDENTYDNYPLTIIKMCKKNTKFVGWDTADLGIEPGIFIDIFPMVYVSDDEKERTKKLTKSWYLYKLGILASIKDPILSFSGIKEKIILLGCHIIHYVLKLFHITSKKLYKKARNISIVDGKTNTVASLNTTQKLTSVYNLDDIFPVKKVPFEDTYIYMPKNYDKLLRQMFGDYMQLPPEEKRHNHCPKILVFDIEKEKKGVSK